MSERKNRRLGVTVALVWMPGEDPSCRWQTECRTHDANVGHATRKTAQSFLAVPWVWCEECQALLEKLEQSKITPKPEST